MISMGSREGRNRMDQGFSSCSNRRDILLDDAELEEGEACSYQDDNPAIDPDVALSYIGEKLQNVLGHFQKDFEGLVSAESLGPKNGEYGTFLPAYRRSPVCSHPKSPPKVQNRHTPSSTLAAEGRSHNSVAAASVSHFVKRGAASAYPDSSTASVPIVQSDRSIQFPRVPAIQEKVAPKSENRDQRTLKVRIKVGSENLSVKKNTAIYSGLGLDGSPSPSFDDGLKESQGLLRRQACDSFESPSQILHMMTSFPLFGGCVLSPLMDDLLKLSEKPKQLLDIPARPSSKINQRLFYHVKENQTLSGENTMTYVDKEGICLQEQVGFDFPLKESDIDVVSCEELISNALKLPLLSDSYGTKEEVCPDRTQNSFKNPNGVVNVEGTVIDTNDIRTDLEKSIKFKDLGRLVSGKETLSSVARKKTKKGQIRGSAATKEVAESAKDEAQVLSVGNNSDNKCPPFKSKCENLSMEKDTKKIKDKYSDFFGNLSDHEGETMNSPDVLPDERLKMSELVEKATITYENVSREKTGSVQTNEDTTPEVKKSSKSRGKVVSATPLSGSSNNAFVLENTRPIFDQAFVGADSDVWVQCDECKKWRLLPPGSKEDELPDTWLCSLQTWLPNMNCCGISEEECIKVVRARYNLLPEFPARLDVPLDKLATRTTALETLQPNVSNDGKLKRTSNSPFQDHSNGPSSSSKKKQQSKIKSSTRKDSQLMNAEKTKSSDMSMETNKRKISKVLQSDCHSDGGNFKNPKIEGRRELEQEIPRTSRKSKIRVSLSGNNNRTTPLAQRNEMFDVSSGNGVVAETAGKDQMRNSEFESFGNSKNETGGKRSNQELNTSPDGSNIVPKKRKGNSFKDLPNATLSSVKRMDDDEQLRSKRYRMSKSEGKEASTSKRNSKIDRKCRSISQQITDNNESQQKDSSSAHVAATSSSSKVTVSFKVKYKSQEIKGSPVDSVSSSPLRGSIVDKLASGVEGMVRKDLIDAGVDHKSLIEVQDKNGESVRHQNGDKNQTCQSNMEKNEIKMSESYVEMPHKMEDYEERIQGRTNRVQDNFESNFNTCGQATARIQELTIPECKLQQGNNKKTSPENFDLAKPKSNSIKLVSINVKSQCLPPSDGKKNETSNNVHLLQGNNTSSLSTDVHPKEPHHGLSKITISNGHRVKNKEVSSPHKRDSSSQTASSAIKEAKSLKHLADRVKNADPMESTGLYFDAALKFLHGASLLESGKNESAKQGDIVQAMQIYSDTAKLFRFCAHEYEKSKDMATAALAYKCMEVAYLRVVYSSHNIASRDRSELQTVLQMVPPGESPSSSASDIDNLNNTSTGDKAAQARSVDSPLLVGNLVIAARNRPNFSRLLSFAQNVNSAMEASRKSHIAFGAASASTGHKDTVESITSIKRALDFNFHDVEGLLRLVRLAKEATSR